MSNAKSRRPGGYHEEETAEVIKMAALGRRFQLGTLYDYRTDTIIPGKFQTFLESRTFYGIGSLSDHIHVLYAALYDKEPTDI